MIRVMQGAAIRPYCDYADDELLEETLNLHVESRKLESELARKSKLLATMKLDQKLALDELALRNHPGAWEAPDLPAVDRGRFAAIRAVADS